jgi:hypothetical protein
MELLITKTRKEFEEILTFATNFPKGTQIHEFEKSIFKRLLSLGKDLLKIYIHQKTSKNFPKIHTDSKGGIKMLHSIREKTYMSIFGKVFIPRACYWSKGKGTTFPISEELNIPANQHSYLLQEWSMQIASDQSFQKTKTFIQNIFEINMNIDSLERISKNYSKDISEYYKKLKAPSNEEDILVISIDGKGVPIKKDQTTKKPMRLKKGEKLGKKKMSTVTSVYTIEKHKRTPEDILKPKKDKSKPKPLNKIVRATLDKKEKSFETLENEIDKRDPHDLKEKVALIDGERKLRQLVKNMKQKFCIILDIYHVMEYIWIASHVFYKEGTKESQNWTEKIIKELLKGNVEDIILYLQGKIKYSELSTQRIKSLNRVTGYLERGKEFMKYNEYLEKGYPIGSGVVEGACRNLVKDRMELTGMRWTIEGAEAILKIRSIYINKKGNEYWKFRIEQERKRLYKNFLEEGNYAAA